MALIKSRRAPVRGDPFFPGFQGMPGFDELENRMRRMLDTNFSMPDADLYAQPLGFVPPANVVENEAMLTLSVELPGLEQKDLDITVDDGVLTVRGEKLEEKAEGDKKYHLVERSYGSFQRSFLLPRSVDATKIAAEFEKGVLKVLLPKTADAKAKGRKVEITAK